MKCLEYPFDAQWILKKKKSLRRQLLAEGGREWLPVKVAILGGSTTDDIRAILELFLLNQGIRPQFYESEYGQYYADGKFPNPALEAFAPDVVYVCTSIHNLTELPLPTDGPEQVERKLSETVEKFTGLWDHLDGAYRCPVIQNNFEYPSFRLLGNRDASDVHGRVNFVTRLNLAFSAYAQAHQRFFICDVNYLSASYGLEKWSDPSAYHLYKYALAIPAIPLLAFNVSNIIKSIYGKNKKVLNLDLDNTLWGGVVGDDGPEGIEIGQETPLGQTYGEFQEYLALHKQLGVLLTVNSKNEEENALAGLARPDSVLKADDFAMIKANWREKSENLLQTAKELSLLPESFVFVDDNPAERALVEAQVPGAAVPAMGDAEEFIRVLDRSGFFEVTSFSEDDRNRTRMYQENAARAKLAASFQDYGEYLQSLQMKGEIRPFAPLYFSRIAQLTNKSNQFNLTTRRYNAGEIEAAAGDPSRITLYGKLEDRFGDNGVVSLIIGRLESAPGAGGKELHIELWLMSCRVLKRQMEFAMMDALAETALKAGVSRIVGYYFPTAKNGMVKDFYAQLGFTKVSGDEAGNSVWEFFVTGGYQKKQHVIAVNVQ